MSYLPPTTNQPGYQPFPQAQVSTPLYSTYDTQDDISSSGYLHHSSVDTAYKRRSQNVDAYNDPYGSQSLHPTGRGDGPPAVQSSTSIGPWDSASQRSLSTTSRHAPLPATGSVPLSEDGNGGRHLKYKSSNMTTGGLSYIDEEGDYYRSKHPRPASAGPDDELEMRGLVSGAANMGARDGAVLNGTYGEGKYQPYDEASASWPPLANVNVKKESRLMTLLLFPTGLDRVLGLFGWDRAKVPVDQAIERKRRSVPGQRWPVMTWLLTAGEFSRRVAYGNS